MAYRAALLSLGCKVNSYETERIREDMVEKGFQIVDFDEVADVYIVNTCSVTNIADRKSRQMLHKAKSLNPNAVIVATGCYVQTEKDKEKLNEIADILVGNNHKGGVAEAVVQYLEKKTRDYKIYEDRNPNLNEDFDDSIKTENDLLDDISNERNVERFSIADYPERSRAFVRIEDGCNQFCSYCIIPYARGRVRSRSEEDILKEVVALADRGFKEVVLTGIHISSFGFENYEKALKPLCLNEKTHSLELEGFDGTPLVSLIKKISDVNGIERIRLGSLEPRIITKDFVEKLKEIPSICPHFHLSLQSGCDTVLKRMNRHYSAEEFLNKCRILREVYDNPAITTDVIVGFPGETEEEFTLSMEMCREARFSKMHIFKFSRRKGTVADRMPGQLTEKVKHERSIRLQNLDDEMKIAYLNDFVGKEVKILVEEQTDGFALGLTERYVQVRAEIPDLDASYINEILYVKVEKVLPEGILFGKLQKNT